MATKSFFHSTDLNAISVINQHGLDDRVSKLSDMCLMLDCTLASTTGEPISVHNPRRTAFLRHVLACVTLGRFYSTTTVFGSKIMDLKDALLESTICVECV